MEDLQNGKEKEKSTRNNQSNEKAISVVIEPTTDITFCLFN
jgi:hypothetical protein